MKSKRKISTNRELEKRTDILMMEIQKQNHAIDTLFMTLAHYIEMNGHSDKVRAYMLEKNKETEDVRPKLQKPGS